MRNEGFSEGHPNEAWRGLPRIPVGSIHPYANCDW